jgi:HEAT repeat protein
MSVTPESIKQALGSDDLGDRLRAVNQLRQLNTAIAFELVQTAIADANARVRYAAVSQMSTLGNQDLSVSLTTLRDRLLNDPEPDVQAAAADSLGALKLTAAFEDLQHLYAKTSEWLVQFSIIAALGELGDPRSFDLLQTALNSDQDLIQTAAIGSLGELGDPRAVPLLVPYATNPDWQIRHRLVQALDRLGGHEAKILLQQLAKDSMPQVAEAAERSLKSQ